MPPLATASYIRPSTNPMKNTYKSIARKRKPPRLRAAPPHSLLSQDACLPVRDRAPYPLTDRTRPPGGRSRNRGAVLLHKTPSQRQLDTFFSYFTNRTHKTPSQPNWTRFSAIIPNRTHKTPTSCFRTHRPPGHGHAPAGLPASVMYAGHLSTSAPLNSIDRTGTHIPEVCANKTPQPQK